MSLKLMMTLAFTSMQERAFMNRTVRDIMWGYDDPLVNLINKYFPGMLPIKGKFGLFSEVSVSRASTKRCGGGTRGIRSHSDRCHLRFWAWGELQARCDPGSHPLGLVPGTRSFVGRAGDRLFQAPNFFHLDPWEQERKGGDRAGSRSALH